MARTSNPESRTTRGVRAHIVEALVADAQALLAAHGHPAELVVRDTDLKGFAVRLRATGRHVYGAAYGRGRFLTLGTTDRLSAGRARKAAREALAETSLDGAPARAQRKTVLTLKSFLDEQYGPWARAHLRSADGTLARLRVAFADWLPLRLSELSAFGVERWRTARLKTVTRSTVNRDVAALRAALSKAVAWKLLKTHPLAGVTPYRLDTRGVVRFLATEEETRLREALTVRDEVRRQERESANAWRRARGYPEWPPHAPYTDHLTPLVLVALNTGMRRGELFGLLWADVDLARAVLTVRGEGAKGGQTRHIPLNTEAVKVLTTWRGTAASDLVFPSPMDPAAALEDIKSAWLALVRAAKLEAFRFHDLRHDFASKLVMLGVDLNTVRELLGHGDIKMTLRYAHLAPETKAAAVARLIPPA